MNNIVLIESPYRNGDRNRNLRYLSWCEYDSFLRGEVPIASHGNCTAYVSEDDESRAKGFAWRDVIRRACDYVVFYTDLGMSEGQQLAEQRDAEAGIKCERRQLPPDLLTKFAAGGVPPGSMRRVAFVPTDTRLDGPRIIERSLREDGWRRYRAEDKDGFCGSPLLHAEWSDNGVLLELESRGYLPLHGSRYTLVREGEQIRVERSGLVLLLTPVEL
jgi:hypothetical protein